jgi:DNA-binding NarL/FixJ family response regulator
MPEKVCGIILFAQPGRIFTSLRVLLKSLFPLIQIKQTEDRHTLMHLLAGDQPWLILIDADLPENEGWCITDRLKPDYPRHHYMLMTHQMRQDNQAQLAGLDSLLLEGMTAADLYKGIGNFLQD